MQGSKQRRIARLVRDECGPAAVAAFKAGCEKGEPWAVQTAQPYVAGKPQPIEVDGGHAFAGITINELRGYVTLIQGAIAAGIAVESDGGNIADGARESDIVLPAISHE